MSSKRFVVTLLYDLFIWTMEDIINANSEEIIYFFQLRIVFKNLLDWYAGGDIPVPNLTKFQLIFVSFERLKINFNK